jgi:SARP family transcriptional regulator, regulator of embCAB operon
MGEIRLVAGDHVVTAEQLPGRQGRLAAAFLLTERHRPVSRDELADVLWPDRPPPRFDVAVSAVVSKLRVVLERLGLGREAVTTVSGCYRIALGEGAWVDVEAATEGVHLAEGALLGGRPADAYGHAVVAAAILRRPFLPGIEGPWIEGRRQTLRQDHLRALDCLAQIHEWNGEHPLALRAAVEAVELEPYRETGHRRLMWLHQQAGDWAEGLRVYARLAEVLDRDLATEPGTETRALRDALVRARARKSKKC